MEMAPHFQHRPRLQKYSEDRRNTHAEMQTRSIPIPSASVYRLGVLGEENENEDEQSNQRYDDAGHAEEHGDLSAHARAVPVTWGHVLR